MMGTSGLWGSQALPRSTNAGLLAVPHGLPAQIQPIGVDDKFEVASGVSTY